MYDVHLSTYYRIPYTMYRYHLLLGISLVITTFCSKTDAVVLDKRNNVVIRIANDGDISRSARLLSNSMYDGDIPIGQRNELSK